MLQADKGMVCEQLKILIGRDLIKEMEPDKWVRNVLDKTTTGDLSTFLCSFTVFFSLVKLYKVKA